MKIYFNENGHITNLIRSAAVATSHLVDFIDCYASFDISQFIPNITIRRPDKVVFGPFNMDPVLNAEGAIDFYRHALTSDETAVSGEIEITIRFEKYEYDEELQTSLPVVTKTMAMAAMPIYKAVSNENRTILSLQIQIRELEQQIVNIIQNFQNMDQIVVTEGEEPENPTENLIWFNVSLRR